MPETTSRDRASLAGEVFDILKQRIIRWQYPPGHRFTEQELCEEFDVSRSPVREALRMLAENNLVEKGAHRGYNVRQPTAAEVHELYDVRLALETYIVERLAQQGLPPEAEARLRHTWQSLCADPPPAPGAAAGADEDFHESLARATGNRTLADMLRNINERLHFLRLADITTSERLTLTCAQHLEILDHIAAGDVPAARAALARNVEQGRQHVHGAFMQALAQSHAEAAGTPAKG